MTLLMELNIRKLDQSNDFTYGNKFYVARSIKWLHSWSYKLSSSINQMELRLSIPINQMELRLSIPINQMTTPTELRIKSLDQSNDFTFMG